MELVDTQARSIYFLVEINEKDMKSLEFILANSELNFNSKIPEQKEAAEYLTDRLYPFVKKTVEGINNVS